MRVLPRQRDQNVTLPQPTASYRRRAWFDFQLALDPLAPPKRLRLARR